MLPTYEPASFYALNASPYSIPGPNSQPMAMKRLVAAVQELSLARDLNAVMAVVRRAARELTGADGATFVLREGDRCFYADENAIEPLWKGQRFPMTACISGWAMLNRKCAVIEDIYSDRRIPADIYRPTFVKSLVMVPVRTKMPIAAIGNYWATHHLATLDEVELLQALANTTAVALENVELYQSLERRVEERTLQLRQANHELYSVSHDLRSPLQQIDGFAALLAQHHAAKLDDQGRRYVAHIRQGAKRMAGVINDLLRLAKLSETDLQPERVSLTAISRELIAQLEEQDPARGVTFQIEDGLEVMGDAGLLQVALANLLSNAWKYTAKVQDAEIVIGSYANEGGRTYFVADNGAGFDMKDADRLFTPFQRLHKETEFAGNGVGLATVHRIIHRHGGRIWATAEAGKGATFYFTLPAGVTRTAGEIINAEAAH